MNNWFKRLFGLENDEEDEKRPNQKPGQTRSGQQRIQYNQQNRDAKVVYDYPKGHFRFPVIPDAEQNRHTRNSNVNSTINQSAPKRTDEPLFKRPRPTVEQPLGMTRKEYRSGRRERSQANHLSHSDHSNYSNNNNPSPKSPFKPTEVPSPIYGFHRPEPIAKHHKTASLYDDLVESEVSATSEMASSTMINEQAGHSPIAKTDEFDDRDLRIQDLKIEDYNPSEIEHEEVIVTSEDREDTIAAVEKIPEQPEVQVDQTEEEIPKQPAAIENTYNLKKQTDEVNRKRNGVPFNVLMLKQDRETINKCQPVKEVNENGILKPPLSLLDVPPIEVDEDEEWLQEQSMLLDHAFESFNVGAKVVKATKGPSVTQFEVQPDLGVRVNKITNLSDDLKLALAAKDIRIEAPIPGKSTVGIEVPNRKSRPVLIREILRSPVFQKNISPLVVALGLDISGQPIVTDLKKMPHGLIAGATGSGKSVCINSIIISLLYKASPHEVKLMLIDPKMVELAPYNGIPHLVSPVITDVKAATAALKWAVEEMERRYEVFAHEGVRDITRYNEKVQSEDPKAEIMPYLVIIIDELADLMMVSPADVEDAICRIAQKARACGIHLLLATQRPSVDVITGLIKANVPTRIAFSVSSQVDSRTIIDMSGAEKLLGRGDMLFLENGSNKPVRIQGNFVKDEEIERVTHFVRKQMKPNYLFVQEELVKQSVDIGVDDELFEDACQFVIEQEGASASSLQRRFRIGYNRAARLVDMMEAQGIVSEPKGSKPREVLISKEQLENRN